MEVTIKLKYLRHSARKLSSVTPQFVGMNLDKAIKLSSVMPQDSAFYLNKALKMAADLSKQKEIDPDSAVITQLITNIGPKIKRTRPSGRGNASRYNKHLAHLVVSVGQKKESKKGKDDGTEN